MSLGRSGVIERGHLRLSICRQCCLIGLSRSTWHHRPKGESAVNLELMRRIVEQFLEAPFYGSRQMKKHLWHQGIKIGRDRVRRLMRKMGLGDLPEAQNESAASRTKIYPYMLVPSPSKLANDTMLESALIAPIKKYNSICIGNAAKGAL